MLERIFLLARKRMRNGRDYLRALARRVEVDAQELRIMGSKSELLRTLVAASGAKTAGFGVPGSVPKWRARRDLNSCPPEFVVQKYPFAALLKCTPQCGRPGIAPRPAGNSHVQSLPARQPR